MKYLQYLPELAFFSLLVRVLCLGSGFGEAIVFFSLVLLMAYREFSTKNKIQDKQRLESMVETIKKEKDEQFQELKNRLDHLALQANTRNIKNEPQSQVVGQPKRYY